jgi:heterodisulfide reductase subunit B
MGGNLIEIRSAVKFEYYDRLLENFVLLNNKIRKLGTIHKQIGKNNNNTFYGRLGMNPERLEEVILTDKDKKPKNYEKLSENLGITTAYVKKEKTTSNVSISAAITSKARIKLYKGFI